MKFQVTMKRVVSTWWPLAASWLLMGVEIPVLSAVMARLANPAINLAAYGGVVYPLSLIIEAPIIMLLAASTALSKDWASYHKMRRFMMAAGAGLTALHILVAFTPVYDWLVGSVLGVPPAIREPARLGLKLMTPWTWSIAYRRFNQGVLIRFGRSQTIMVGTFIRLAADGLVLASGLLVGTLAGIAVAASSQAAGVLSEAFYVGVVVRPVLNGPLRQAPPLEPALTWKAFFAFYLPLVMTSLLNLIANPLGSAAISRMPQAILSLAVWPVLTGLVFVFRSLGIAYNEVVVSLLDTPGSYQPLQRFTCLLGAAASGALLLVAVTPLANFWFSTFSALSPELASMARQGLWFALPLPALSVLQSWFQGAILHGRRTRGITESVVVYLVTNILLLFSGVSAGRFPGLYIGLMAMLGATLAQTGWLWFRSQPAIAAAQQRDQAWVLQA